MDRVRVFRKPRANRQQADKVVKTLPSLAETGDFYSFSGLYSVERQALVCSLILTSSRDSSRKGP